MEKIVEIDKTIGVVMTTPMVFPQAETGSTLGNIFLIRVGQIWVIKMGHFSVVKNKPVGYKIMTPAIFLLGDAGL